MMAYLWDIQHLPWAWRKHTSDSMICTVGNLDGMPAPSVEFSAHTQWTVDCFYILGNLFFQECGRTVKIGEAETFLSAQPRLCLIASGCMPWGETSTPLATLVSERYRSPFCFKTHTEAHEDSSNEVRPHVLKGENFCTACFRYKWSEIIWKVILPTKPLSALFLNSPLSSETFKQELC